MARITRKLATIFGANSGFQQISQFGSLAAGSPGFTTDPESIQFLSNWIDGWFAAVIGSNSPAIEDMNAFCYVMAYQVAYLLQNGIAEWNTATTYYTGQFASDGAGKVYVSLTNSNTGNALTNASFWRPFQSTVFNAIIGSAAEVTAGKATHSTWASAIAATSAGQIIQVLPGTWVENVTLTSQRQFEGSGYGSYLNGTFSTTGVANAGLEKIRISGSITFDATSTGCYADKIYQPAPVSLIDNNGGFNFFGTVFPT